MMHKADFNDPYKFIVNFMVTKFTMAQFNWYLPFLKDHHCINISVFYCSFSLADHCLVYCRVAAAEGPLQLNSPMLFGQRSTHTPTQSVLLKINSHTYIHILVSFCFSLIYFPQPFHQCLHPTPKVYLVRQSTKHTQAGRRIETELPESQSNTAPNRI